MTQIFIGGPRYFRKHPVLWAAFLIVPMVAAFAMLVLGAVAALGYAIDNPALYGYGGNPISLASALCFFMAGFSIIPICVFELLRLLFLEHEADLKDSGR